jgi:hypothetical protein
MTHHIAIGDRGSDLSGRSLGRELRHEAIAAIEHGEMVVLSFVGVKSASDSFLDELFAVLVATRGTTWFRENVRVQGIEASILRDLIAAVQRRLEIVSRRSGGTSLNTPPPSC